MSWIQEETIKSLRQRAHVQEGQKQDLSLYMKIYTTKRRRNQQISPPKDIGLIHPKCIQFHDMDEMNPVTDSTWPNIKTESVRVVQKLYGCTMMSNLPSPLDLYHFNRSRKTSIAYFFLNALRMEGKFYWLHQTLVGKWSQSVVPEYFTVMPKQE